MADAQKETERKGFANVKAGTEAGGSPDKTEQLVVTINPAMGTIVEIEKVDKSGRHHEFSEGDWANLVGADEVEEIEAALAEAFEAGVAGVLGEEYDSDGDDEDEENKAIRRFLISEVLVPASVRRRIVHRLLLNRMVRRRLSKRSPRQ